MENNIENTTKKSTEKNIPPNTITAEQDLEGTISFREGFNYSFIEGDHTVYLNCSAVNGKERLYVDDVLVSGKWSFRRKSIHHFSIGADSYEVELHVVNMFTGETHCTLIKNDVHVKTIKKALKKSRQLSKDKLWWYIPYCFLAGGLLGFLLAKVFFMLFGK
ncbi:MULTISPECIES: hypothetical protein [unclassified Colwellia]|jgi:hypothetical protein|uniref:hypothetical protein n=1 Tax=unclassified Colwellia TaxID=196834 RepID=UPI0015F74C1C|nr:MULTISPECIES: hypothetical protein [unclassified Colwellia]MBA6250733.1 hypothetical protein [Colwellia sp. MB3u-55]MBA6398897.1 hypothetical protein [Colwellia sp. BRX10-4]